MMAYPGISPKFTGVHRTRKIVSMGAHLGCNTMTTHNNSLANLIRGVGERVLYIDSVCTRPIQAVPGIFVKRLGSYRRIVASSIGRPSPVSRDDFPKFYKGPRADLYAKAAQSLELKPVRRSDSYLSTFVKSEKLNLTLKADPVPRVIQPRNPRYNVEVGRFLRAVEHKVYDGVDALFGSPTIFSPYNAFQQAKHLRDKWDSFARPVCVGLDASRFDQHVGVQALSFEHGFYDLLFNNGELSRLLRWQLENKGFAVARDGEFSYETLGKRMSGDMNTSMGNKFIMCLIAKWYIDSKDFRIEFVNNGDDCLLITERSNLSLLADLKAQMREFGFNIVTEDPVFEFEQIEFCQTKPVCCNGVWRMVRNVKTCLTKDLTSTNLGHRVDEYRSWLKDVGGCGLAIASDVPVLGSFYRMMERLGESGPRYNGMLDTEYKWYHTITRDCKSRSSTVDDYGRYSFWLSTDITPDQQLELEAHFDQVVWGADKRQLITPTRLGFLLNENY